MRRTLSWIMAISCLVITGIMLTGCQGRVPIKITDQKQQDPRMIRVANKHELIGDHYYERVRVREAIQEWQIALELMPDDYLLVKKIQAAQTDKQLVMGADGKLKAAGEKIAPAKNDSKVIGGLNQAEHYYEQSQLKEAKVAWQRILEMEPDNREAKAGLARLADETYKKDSDRGLDEITESLYDEGMRAYRKRNWLLAKVKLSEAAKLNADQPQVKKYLQKAKEECRVIEASAEVQDIIAKANVAQKQKKWQKAWDLWKHILKLKPEDSQAQEGIKTSQQQLKAWADKKNGQAKQAADKKQWQKASKIYMQVLKVFPNNQTANVGATFAKSKIKRDDDHDSNKKQAEQAYNEGVKYYREKNYAQAIQKWKIAQQYDTDNPLYEEWIIPAENELRKQKKDKLRKAQVLYQDGLAAYQRGELEEAVEALEAAIALDLGNERYKKSLDKIKKELI